MNLRADKDALVERTSSAGRPAIVATPAAVTSGGERFRRLILLFLFLFYGIDARVRVDGFVLRRHSLC